MPAELLVEKRRIDFVVLLKAHGVRGGREGARFGAERRPGDGVGESVLRQPDGFEQRQRGDIERGPTTGTPRMFEPLVVERIVFAKLTIPPRPVLGAYTRYCAVVEPLRAMPIAEALAGKVAVSSENVVFPSQPERLSLIQVVGVLRWIWPRSASTLTWVFLKGW